MKRYPDPDKDKTEADRIQQWKANLMPDKIVYDTITGMFMDPFKVEKGRLRADLGEQAQDSRAREGRRCTKWSFGTCEVVANRQMQHSQKRTGQDAVGRECGAECRSW